MKNKKLKWAFVVVFSLSVVCIPGDAFGERKMETIKLSEPETSGTTSVEEAISKRRSERNLSSQKLTFEQISRLCWAAQGITDRARGYAGEAARLDPSLAKEAEAVAAITQPASPPPVTPPAPTTPAAPASVVPTAPAPVASNLVDYSTLSAEASAKHQQLSMSGRGQELIDLLGQYGVQRLDALPQEQWGNFLTSVRAL